MPPAAVVALAALLAGGGRAAAAAGAATVCRAGSAPMARVELYFGGSSGRSWRRFLAGAITPRFPNGLTSVDAAGQWRGPHGLQREAAHVVIVFYTPDATSEGRIEAIRTLYKRQFRQASVLRADTTACVGF